MQLVQIGLQDLARMTVIGVDHAPPLFLDLMGGLLRHFLVLRDAAPEEHLAFLLGIG